jgi:Polyketide cyclase / dehydrase and lipid transport
MTRVEMEVHTRLAPEQARAALLDFTDRRPDIWTQLSREYWKFYSTQGATAEVREGSTKPFRIWARETYDWSDPDVVRWEMIENPGVMQPGSYVSARIVRAHDGGSDIHLTWDRTPISLKGRFVALFMKTTKGSPVAKYVRQSLDKLADDGYSATGPSFPERGESEG